MARPITTLFIALALFVGASPLWAARSSQPPTTASSGIKARPQFGPLNAAQIGQVQGLGRAVLTARHGQQPSAEEQALVKELHALSVDLDQALQPSPASVYLATASPVVVTPSSVRQDRIRNLLAPRLTSLHQRRQALLDIAHNKSTTSTNEAKAIRFEHLSAQAGELEQSVQAALALPDAQRFQKLMDLRERMRPRSLSELQRERMLAAGNPEPEAEPTLTTIVHHRLGPDAARAGLR